MPRRKSSGELTYREQVVAAAIFGFQEQWPGEPVWSRDIEGWLRAQPDGPRVNYSTIDSILGRFEDWGWMYPLYEQFVAPEGRTPRKYDAVTPLGEEQLIHAVQQLRASSKRPDWLPLPEHERRKALAESGSAVFRTVRHPAGFERSELSGRLVTFEDVGTRRLKVVGDDD